MDAGWVTIIGGFLGALVTGFFTWAGNKVAAKNKTEVAEVEARHPEWQAFLNEVNAHNDRKLSELRGEISDLTGRVNALQSKVETVQTKYRYALRYVRAWRLLHPESIGRIDVPDAIKDDI